MAASARRSSPAVKRQRPIETIVRDPDLIEDRHERIFRAATRIFIAKGYHQATVREIAEEAGLSLGGLYTYVKTKEDILYLVFKKLTTTLQESVRRAVEGIDDPAERVRVALDATVRTAERYQDEILLMYLETKSLGRRSLHAVLAGEADYVAFFEKVLEDGYEQKLFKGNRRLSADIIAFLCSIVVLRRWNLRRRFSPDEVRRELVAFILRGLGVEGKP